jgi:hypothetical protein
MPTRYPKKERPGTTRACSFASRIFEEYYYFNPHQEMQERAPKFAGSRLF